MKSQRGFTVISSLMSTVAAAGLTAVMATQVSTAVSARTELENGLNSAHSICMQVNREAGFGAPTCNTDN